MCVSSKAALPLFYKHQTQILKIETGRILKILPRNLKIETGRVLKMLPKIEHSPRKSPGRVHFIKYGSPAPNKNFAPVSIRIPRLTGGSVKCAINRILRVKIYLDGYLF